LIRRKRGADVVNYHVSAPASGDFAVQVQLRPSSYSYSSKQQQRVLTARIYNDLQLTADGTEWKAREEIWSQSIEEQYHDEGEEEEGIVVRLHGTIPNVQQWTAETPNLYTLVLELKDSDGNTTQVESCRIGFRSIDIDAETGILHVNGKRITVCGINRHEHDPDHGKVVSLERMHQDITVLK
jgi:beta-galactosidase/beta-glucuronidase